MFDHIGIRVNDLDASIRFYSAALGPLGLELCTRDESSAGFGPPGAPALWLYLQRGARGVVHVALSARTRESVERFHRAGVAAGARDHGAPGVRSDYHANYYAAFLLDPDGNNVEAVCTAEG